MVKVGVDPDAVRIKMRLDGADPGVLDQEEKKSLYTAPLDAVRYRRMVTLAVLERVARERDAPPPPRPPSPPSPPQLPSPPAKRVLRQLQAVDHTQLSPSSFWLHDDGARGLMLNAEECARILPRAAAEKVAMKTLLTTVLTQDRTLTCGISLAHIPFSNADLQTKVRNIDERGFTPTQLAALERCLPTPGEAVLLRAQARTTDGDLASAEQFMRLMLSCSFAYQRIACMRFKLTFGERYDASVAAIHAVQRACADVRASRALQTILLTIRNVRNQLVSDDRPHIVGFSLGALPLHSTTFLTTFTCSRGQTQITKTTMLTTIVRLLARSDASALRAPDELLPTVSAVVHHAPLLVALHAKELMNECEMRCGDLVALRAEEPQAAIAANVAYFEKVRENVCEVVAR